MRRWALLLLFCFFTSGCVSSQIIPKESVLFSLRTISVIPIEGTPLVLNPDTLADVKTIRALMQSTEHRMSASGPSTNGPKASPFGLDAPLAAVSPPRTLGAGAILELPVAALAGRKVPGETAVVEMDQPSQSWMPSMEFAKTAMKALQEGGKREVRMIDGYVKPPIMDRSITSHMENWLGPIRCLYSSDVSTIDYTTVSPEPADAVLEVGMLQYEYSIGRLFLTVFVRLVDPRTKQILARRKDHSYSKAGALPLLLQNNGAGMKRLIVETGNLLVTKCLTEIGLTSK